MSIVVALSRDERHEGEVRRKSAAPGSSWNGRIRPDLKSTSRSGLTTTCEPAKWSSREQFEAYGEKLMPILSDMGIEFSAEPEIFEVQNLVK